MNPFPGMNPFLEDPAYWPDFHARFITYLSDAIAEHLPDAYESRIDESVRLVQMSPEKIKLFYPDIAVSQESSAPASTSRKSGNSAILEPHVLPQELFEEVRETNIEILHRPERDLIAVIELLSPANKVGDGFRQYLAKRNTLLREQVHLLELDFLLQGERLPLLKQLPKGDYYAFLTRATNRAHCEVYALSMRQKLPTLPIPLRTPDADLHVDLQRVFDEAFQRGRYGRSLDYARSFPFGNAEQRKWMEERLGSSS